MRLLGGEEEMDADNRAARKARTTELQEKQGLFIQVVKHPCATDIYSKDFYIYKRA